MMATTGLMTPYALSHDTPGAYAVTTRATRARPHPKPTPTAEP
jgi:hypothetical protein